MSPRPSDALRQSEFCDLYDAMLGTIGGGFHGREKLTVFWPLVGRDYRIGSGTLVAGRATNQWNVAEDVPATKLRDQGQRRSILSALQEDAQEGFDGWVEDENPRPARRSAFFRVARRATNSPPDAPGWSRRLAWTNLFKVAPASGGNPGSALRDLQRHWANEIFHMEIDALNPKTVLVLAGSDWFDSFQQREGLTLKKRRGRFVEGVATARGRRWIVARHPERKPEDKFVEEIMTCLGPQR